METSNFKLAYSAEAAPAAKAGQTSDQLAYSAEVASATKAGQIAKFKFLNFDFCALNFTSGGGF